MMEQPLVDMIGNVVKAASCEILAQLQKQNRDIKAINYQHGPAVEIKETLKQYDEDPSKCYEKYPLIALITPFAEKERDSGTDYVRCMPKIGIAYHTTKDLKSAERYTHSFNNILIPLYNEFIAQLVGSGYFAAYSERDLKISRSIRDDIGRNPFLNIDGMTSDYIDAIEITSIELPVYPSDCCMNTDFN